MQPSSSYLPATLNAIEATLSPPRLGRYLTAARGDKQLALRLYLWNARLCQEFYLPTQLAEVCIRNTLHRGLKVRVGANWHQSTTVTSQLPDRLKHELKRVIRDETKAHPGAVTSDHIVSGLSFGFWVHLLSRNPRRLVWKGNVELLFPHLPGNVQGHEIHAKVDRLRKWRNRIAHHNAIFDQKPSAEYANISSVIGWVCPDTQWLMRENANPQRVLNERPKM